MTISVFIPRWHPTPVNKLLKLHHMAAHKRKKSDMRLVLAYFQNFPTATGKRLVTLTIHLEPKQRACDPDAYWKVTLDALVACGILTDDNRQGVELAPVQFERGNKERWGTTITLRDL